MGVFKKRLGVCAILAFVSFGLGACDFKQRLSDIGAIQTGGVEKPTPDEVKENQSALRRIALEPGMTPLSYANAGLDRVDRLCGEFFNALMRARRSAAFGRNQMSLFAGATAGILAAAESAAKSIAITAIGFTLVDQTIANYQDIVLFVPVANELHVVTLAGMDSYRRSETFMTSYASLSKGKQYVEGKVPAPATETNSLEGMEAAQSLIGAYAYLCSPAKIEGYVSEALKAVTPDAGGGTGGSASASAAAMKLIDMAAITAKIPPYPVDAMADIYVFLKGAYKDATYLAEFQILYPGLDAKLLTAGAPPTPVQDAMDALPILDVVNFVDKVFAAKASSSIRRLLESNAVRNNRQPPTPASIVKIQGLPSVSLIAK